MVLATPKHRHDDPPDGEVLAHCAATLANLAEDRRNQLQMPKDGAYEPLCRLAQVDLTQVDMNGDGDIDGYGDGGVMHSDVSRCLCSLSSRVENVGSCGGGTPFGPSELQALFHLAGGTCAPHNEHCRKDALVALGNLAITAKSQQAIAKLGGVPCLALGLASEFTSCRLYAARALYRVGVLPENQPLLVSAGAVPPLIQLSGDGRDVEVQRCAVMALCNATVRVKHANENSRKIFELFVYIKKLFAFSNVWVFQKGVPFPHLIITTCPTSCVRHRPTLPMRSLLVPN